MVGVAANQRVALVVCVVVLFGVDLHYFIAIEFYVELSIELQVGRSCAQVG